MDRRPTERRRVPRRARAAVAAVLVGFVVAVYVVIVVGIGALIGRTEAPSLLLSVLATVVVALAFEPVRRRVETAVLQRAGGTVPTPYEVLSHFSDTVTGGYPTEELPARMAMLLAEGTAAEWAQVWLLLQGQLVLAASWPPDAPPRDLGPPEVGPGARDRTGLGRRAIPVRHGGRVYGVFRLQERHLMPLTSTEERLFADLAAQAGLVLRLVGLRAELSAQHRELTARTGELRLSRERLIEAQDDERRRLERDIHDGAQQHLVALAVSLRLAESLATKDALRAAQLLAAQADAARAAIATLSRLAAGIYPQRLADGGVGAALTEELAAATVPVAVVDELPRRLPDPVEAALYFFAMEAVQNAAKHAGASSIVVELTARDDAPRVVVTDDGVGFAGAATSDGSGLSNMRDRIDAVGGAVSIASAPGRGTTVTAVVPAQRAPT